MNILISLHSLDQLTMKSQRELFDLIAKKEFRTKKLMYEYIADFLCVCEDTVSKWSYGTTVLNYTYLKKIVEKFKIRPDEFLNDNTDYFYSKYSSLNMRNISEYREYILSISELLSTAAKCQESKIKFQADEIPIFYFMRYKALTFFKLYVYAYDMNKLEITYEEYVKELDKHALEAIYDSIASNYDNIESMEIWDHGIIDNLLAQIEYFSELGRLESPEVKNQLLNELESLIDNFQNLATSGEKSSGKRFDFFVKPFPLGRSFMIIEANKLHSVSLKVDTINSLTMIHPKIINEYFTTFLSSRDKSVALGIGSEKDRIKYFKSLKDKIWNVKSKDNIQYNTFP